MNDGKLTVYKMKIEEIKSRLALIDDRFLEDLPDGVTLLPKDWSGETTRMVMNFSVSTQAFKNPKFDLQGFIKTKFNITLSVIRRKKYLENLRLTHRLYTDVFNTEDPETLRVYIHIEYAKD